ncbi:30S ribosomal protein S5 [Holosporaceae bacterium 'Namur']|jgi:small subunit ribosomal protein S5|nr:30S ribosomal protein S5 [Holosporaceae bacterium 'Namur']
MSVRAETSNQELSDKLVYVGRCAKVVKGGRRFSFAAIVVTGDGKGKVGLGLGKATEVMDAKEKAVKVARKNMVKIPLRDGRTLHHDITATFCSGNIVMRSAPAGTGIIAGGPVRALLEVLGIKDVVAKSVGTTNPHNMIKAALKALTEIKSPRFIAEKRSKKIGEIVSRRDRQQKDTQE